MVSKWVVAFVRLDSLSRFGPLNPPLTHDPAVARPSVPEALSSLERTAAREGVALHALSELQRQQRVAHMDVQAELAAAGMEVGV